MKRLFAALPVAILMLGAVTASIAQVSSTGLTLPYYAEYGSSTLKDAFAISATSGGRAGVFQALNARDSTNPFDAFLALSNGTGRAAWFRVENPMNSVAALESYTAGKGHAGRFQVYNTSSTSAALSAFTNGAGPAIQGNGPYAGEFNGTVQVKGSAIGIAAPQDALSVQGNIRADQGSQNNGDLAAGAIRFGGGRTGEGIASKRTAGGNQNGLDFYTRNAARLSITSGGSVGIGTATPKTTLDVAGSMHATSVAADEAEFSKISASSQGTTTMHLSASGPGTCIVANSTGSNAMIQATMTGTGPGATFTTLNPSTVNPTVDISSNSSTCTALRVSGASTNAPAVEIYSRNLPNTKSALKVTAGNTDAVAGEFIGRVAVMGIFSKAGGSFKIDHPLDPLNKNLHHSFVESPDMKNIYDGVVTLDEKGEAVVVLPAWFEALNKDFRYQLTCIGGYAQVYIAQEIKDNQFSIAGGTPGLKVSWQVTGIRQDAYANAHRIQVEAEKSPEEKGHYLYPDAYAVSAPGN